MRVGMCLESSPTLGGAYQFEGAILQSLKEHGGNGGHEFVVFGSHFPVDPHRFVAPHLSFVELPKSRAGSGEEKPTPHSSRLQSTLLYRITSKAASLGRLCYPRKRSPGQRINALRTAVAAESIQVMYYPGPYQECLKVQLPYILTVFDLQHRLQPEFPEVSAEGIWEQREKFYAEAIPRALAVIVDSETGKDDVLRFYRVPEKRIKVLPYLPARSTWVTPGANEIRGVLKKYNIPDGYLFYPSQFWPHKNHVGLLQAVYLLRQLYDIVLPVVMVGADKGSLEYIMALIAELDLGKQTYCLGFVPDDDLPGLYRNAFALAMPTFFGPTNLPVIEAFALGCPVITSDIRGIREQVGDAGVLVDPRSPEKMCDGILRLYQDSSLRQTLIERGKQRVATWGPKDYAQNLLTIVDEFKPVRRCWGV